MTPRLRRHQALALDALDRAWAAGRTRAWVELPPGAGKTLVGLETVRTRIAAGAVHRAVVLGPNTAIQGQWLAQAADLGLACGSGRTLDATVTVLTYQALAVFDSDAEVDDEATEQSLLSRLHANGRALVAALQEAGPILLVLDECHHLLEVWGRLLGEVLELVPQAVVLGLTATPPDAMTVDQAALVAELFGETVFEASIPAVVREGDLAPFAELAWLTAPTPVESEWLAGQAARFHDLVHQLTDPSFGTVPFLSWLDARFLAPDVTWSELSRQSPDLCAAALRMHHEGLLALPDGARLTEEHRHGPSAGDWVVLLDDWLTKQLSRTGDPADEAVVEAVRAALPAVGYQWTRSGIRRGRSPVDRVLARSEAKTVATVQIAGIEHRNLGERLRLLVLCDHERASATLPVDLRGVLDRESGSAHAVLSALVRDPTTAALGPMLVTGETVAGAPDTLEQLRRHVGRSSADLAAALALEPVEGEVSRLVGPWTSRQWVAHVTAFFGSGGTRVLVGTRGLLGEGWDARWVTGLVDLTSVTTTTAVVQTRGRALRTDPGWPDKVALTWSVACVAEHHPKGGNDWDRLVRKHAGFFGVDDAGAVVDGVAHLDARFSPFAPPPVAEFDAVNATMAVRSEDRVAVRERWQVGTPYDDEVARTVRIRPRTPARLGDSASAAVVVAHARGLDVRSGHRPSAAGPLAAAAVSVGLLALVVAGGLPVAALAVPALGAVGAAWLRARALVGYGRSVLALAALPPGIGQIARAVADGLHGAALVGRGADGVVVDIEPDGEYRCLLHGVTEEHSDLFAAALDEALGPVDRPRYVVPRWVVGPGAGWLRALGASYARVTAEGEVWHPVPSVLGVNAARARAYALAWDHWVGGGNAVYTGSPEGAGVLAAQQGADPFDVTTVMRRHWS